MQMNVNIFGWMNKTCLLLFHKSFVGLCSFSDFPTLLYFISYMKIIFYQEYYISAILPYFNIVFSLWHFNYFSLPLMKNRNRNVSVKYIGYYFMFIKIQKMVTEEYIIESRFMNVLFYEQISYIFKMSF